MLQSLCVYEVHVNAAHNLKSLGSSLLLLGLTWSCMSVPSAPAVALHISEASSTWGSKPSGQGSFSSSSRSWAVWRYTGKWVMSEVQPRNSNTVSFEGRVRFKTKSKARPTSTYCAFFLCYCHRTRTKLAKHLRVIDVEEPWVAG